MSNVEMFGMFNFLAHRTILFAYLEEGQILSSFSRLYRKGIVTAENFKTKTGIDDVITMILDEFKIGRDDEWRVS